MYRDQSAGRPGGVINWYSLLEKGEWEARAGTDRMSLEQDDRTKGNKEMLLCSRCGHPITSKNDRFEMNGAHRHTFANPHGYVHHIGCFRHAPGCAVEPEVHTTFSWFEGYTWALASCALCGNHLGWQFQSDKDRFLGLLLASLVEKDTM